MTTLVQSHLGVPDNLRKLLAVAVKSIQWSYAVFWSISADQEGALEWTDGYYNGDIKTRKTVQAIELKADKSGLQRSAQLRELYESLLDAEIEQQAKRPSAALSPEDLSDGEWYYLVCMSFMFNVGEDLVGRALANKQTVWLCNAQHADSKVFSRSLLAKSASVQTVICFPYLEGVIELGVTDLVMEDHNLIQHIKASLLDISKPVCSEKYSSARSRDDGESPIAVKVDNESADTLPLENLFSTTVERKVSHELTNEFQGNMHEELDMDSLDDCSNCCEHNHQNEDSLVPPGASQVQSWHFMDDEFSNGVPGSLNSNDCISEAFANQVQDKARVSPEKKHTNHVELKELQDGNDTKFSSLDLGAEDDLHFKRILSVITRSNINKLIQDSAHHGSNFKSSFVSWNKGRSVEVHRLRGHQSALKKVVFSVPFMYSNGSLRSNNENGEKDCTWKVDSNQLCKENNLSDKQVENEKFMVLGSMVPSATGLCKKRENENFQVLKSMLSAADKALMLDDMIKYLKELEARVEELESCVDSVDYEAKPKRNFVDMVEEISDNYENKKTVAAKKTSINKRKASDIDGADTEPDGVVAEDGSPLRVNVCMKEKEVVVEMSCPYKEYILLDIMDEINNLHLDVHTVQSSTTDGIVKVILKSKFRGAAVAPARMIKQALWKIAG